MNVDESQRRTRDQIRLKALRSLKSHYQSADNISPFATDQTVRYGTPPEKLQELHVDQIHGVVRERLFDALGEVRRTGQSHIAMLVGDPGVGKTHTLEWLRDPARAEKSKYVFVLESNHWELRDLERLLLDRMVEAITDSRRGESLLHQKMKYLGFRMLDDIVPDRYEVARLQVRQPIVARLRAWLQPKQHSLGALHERGDLDALRRLDRTELVNRFCLQFLAHSEEARHKRIVEQLFSYLLDEGQRDAIKRWLQDDSTTLDLRVEMIRVLASLFAPPPGQALEEPGNPTRVFVLAFDQLEARSAFMRDDHQGWLDFFGRLSELYNSLPNVLLLFTLPLHLSKALRGRMQAQFRDRVGNESRYQLELPTLEQVRLLYQHRLERWLGPAANELLPRLTEAEAPLLPFGGDDDLRSILVDDQGQRVGNVSIRRWLERLDAVFSARMAEAVVEPELDFLVALQDLRGREPTELRSPEHRSYVEPHIKMLGTLLKTAPGALELGWGLKVQVDTPDHLDLARGASIVDLVFRPSQEGIGDWVRTHVVGLRARFTMFKDDVDRLLDTPEPDRVFAWCLRAGPIGWPPGPKERLLTVEDFPPRDQTVLHALSVLLERRASYASEEATEAFHRVIVKELRNIWVGKLLDRARRRAYQDVPAGEVPRVG